MHSRTCTSGDRFLVAILIVFLLIPFRSVSAASRPGDSEAPEAEAARAVTDFGPILRNLMRSGVLDRKQAEDLTRRSRELNTLRDRIVEGERGVSDDLQSHFYTESQAISDELELLVESYIGGLREAAESGEIPRGLADQLTEKCQSALPRLLPFYRSQVEALASGRRSDESTLYSHKAAIDECTAYLDRALSDLSRDLLALEAELARLHAEKAELLEAYDQAETEEERKEIQKKIDEKDVEIKETEHKIKKKQEVKGKLDLGKVISGVIMIAVGVALAVFSSGAAAQLGYGMIAGGVTMAVDGIDDASDGKTVTTDVPDPNGPKKVRVVDEDRDATDDEAAESVRPYVEQGYQVVSAGSEGNFSVLISPAGEWLVLQLVPRSVVQRIPADAVDVPENPRGIERLSDLREVRVNSLRNIATSITIDFSATTTEGGDRFAAGLSEIGTVTGRFLLSIGDS